MTVTELLNDIRRVSESTMENPNRSGLPTPTSDPSKNRLQFVPTKRRMSSSAKAAPPTLPLLVNEAKRELPGGSVGVNVEVGEGVELGVLVFVGVGVSPGVGVSVDVGVSPGVGVSVGVGVSEGVGVSPGVGVSVACPAPTQLKLPESVKVCPAIGTNSQS